MFWQLFLKKASPEDGLTIHQEIETLSGDRS
jgi:hypothetical protein